MLEQKCVPLRRGRFQGESLVAPVKKTSNPIINLTEKPSSIALPKSGKATDTSKIGLLNTSAGYDIYSVIAELEKRRAKLLVLARAAEARAREVEEEFEQYKSRLKQETKHRSVAEQKLSEFKEDRLRLLGAEADAHEDTESHLMFGLSVVGNGGDEQKTRRKAEKNRAVIELKKWEKERERRNTEERHRQQGNGPKNFILYGTVIALLVGACWLFISTFP
ncbi:MAG TPA: hypothetical protein VJ810_31605 [Blastocatellia bacterium]|nr:hypothetical protein [Blastocatellia bacterium]